MKWGFQELMLLSKRSKAVIFRYYGLDISLMMADFLLRSKKKLQN